jgi:peptide/nickel transport system substrate-binding protein
VQKIVINDPAARVIAFEAGEIDFLQAAPTSEGPRLLDLGYLRVGKLGSPYNIGFNITTAPFDDYRVREGISLVLDVDSAWKAVLPEGFAVRAYGHQGPWNVFNYDPTGLMDFDRYDVAAGLSMLADAGWTDSNGDGWLDKNGTKLSIAIKTWGGDQVQVLTILATQLLEVGIDATVQVVETATYAQDLAQGNSGMFFDYMYSNDTGLYSLFYSSNIGSSNTHFNRDPVLDTLLGTAMGLDPIASANFWKAAEQLVVAHRYIIPIYFAYETHFIASRVKDFISPQGSLELVSVQNNVYLADE